MYLHAHDREAGLLVGVFGGVVTPEQHGDMLASFRQHDLAGVGREDGLVSILVIDPEQPMPGPLERQEVADFWNSIRAPLHVFALVTTSPVARTIATAINWFARPTSNRREGFFKTFEPAALWASAQRGKPLPALTRMHEEIRASPLLKRDRRVNARLSLR